MDSDNRRIAGDVQPVLAELLIVEPWAGYNTVQVWMPFVRLG